LPRDFFFPLNFELWASGAVVEAVDHAANNFISNAARTEVGLPPSPQPPPLFLTVEKPFEHFYIKINSRRGQELPFLPLRRLAEVEAAKAAQFRRGNSR